MSKKDSAQVAPATAPATDVEGAPAPAVDPAPAPAGGPLTDEQVAAVAGACVADPGDFAGYVAADRSGRARIRAAVDALLAAAVAEAAAGDGDPVEVLAAMRAAVERQTSVPAAMKAAAGATPTPTPVDWSALVADRVAVLLAAADGLLSGDLRPDGAPDDWTPDRSALEALVAAATPTPEVAGPILALATKAPGRAKPTHKVADAVIGALTEAGVDEAGRPVPLSLSAIGAWWEANGGPAKSASGGRIAARLFPGPGKECTIPNVRAIPATATAPRMAVLLAAPTDD